jgi:hypothetical protein
MTQKMFSVSVAFGRKSVAFLQKSVAFLPKSVAFLPKSVAFLPKSVAFLPKLTDIGLANIEKYQKRRCSFYATPSFIKVLTYRYLYILIGVIFFFAPANIEGG